MANEKEIELRGRKQARERQALADDEGKQARKNAAHANTTPSLAAARVLNSFGAGLANGDGTTVRAGWAEHVSAVGEIVQSVRDGGTHTLEAMLVSQAVALQNMFANLAERANDAKDVELWKMFMNAAMKAQAQSRATIDSVVNLKYPRQVQFVRQANIAQNQQVNNGTPHASIENENQQTKLLEQSNGQWMDAGAQAATARGNTTLETVATVHRPKD